MCQVKIIAEIGINHNGSLQIAKDLIKIAYGVGCDYVKFQKRTPDLCVPGRQKQERRSTPWGNLSYIDYKRKMEFGKEEYAVINRFCQEAGMSWFSSVWDLPSVDFMTEFASIGKIPSALITNLELLEYARSKFDLLMVSTGMSTEKEVIKAIEVGQPDVIFHTNSCYPAKCSELNLNYILHLREKYPEKAIGYSGHEFGLATTFATVPMGVKYIERHITLDRTMWGSDQMASISPQGLGKLVKGVRDIESALGRIGPRRLFDSEKLKRSSLRG